MERIRLAIGQLLLIGVIVSFVMVVIGGSAYLFSHGADTVHYNSFHGEPQIYKSIFAIFSDAFTLSPLALIQLGLLLLVILQVLRVGLILGLFIYLKDFIFSSICLFILCVLVYSLF